ncbi:hypothetical protein BST61_g1839 [Cercospora zeina]
MPGATQLALSQIKRNPELAGLRDDIPVVFTHADLDFSNIILSDSQDGPVRIKAIIDWHQSGWYPEPWEWLKSQSVVGPHSDWAKKYLSRVLESVPYEYFYAWESNITVKNRNQTECQQKGITTCMAHQQDPRWQPGMGNTKVRNNPNAGKRYHSVISKHIGQASGSRSGATISGSKVSKSGAGNRQAGTKHGGSDDDEFHPHDIASDEEEEGDGSVEVEANSDHEEDATSPEVQEETEGAELPAVDHVDEDGIERDANGLQVRFYFDFEPGFLSGEGE